ncbi:fimbrial protein [Klebsiella sp. BIGb0407]|uniref:fimbrial protein n=1 Tax=Klebsiella sp. BIGb0407 TaxID=2940603 RepID=UPI00216862C6|nr:fimbrial protein [Klebsiella sp. BIGb0407]MCS3433875.1 type 1 fimbria pilin [Klebsiella sp. BIGb0407]
MLNKKMLCYWQALLLGSTLVCSLNVTATDENSRLYRPVDNWNVDGANGVLYVSGSLTESPCRLSMTSAYQAVDLGNTETANLPRVGSKGQPIPFQIELQDCMQMQSNLKNLQTGQVAWSPTQPAVKIRFVAPSVPFMPQFARVMGVQGLGLELSTGQGQPLTLDKESNPLLIDSGQNVLTYYVTPVRTAEIMQPGAYSALISFEMLYE